MTALLISKLWGHHIMVLPHESQLQVFAVGVSQWTPKLSTQAWACGLASHNSPRGDASDFLLIVKSMTAKLLL